MSEYVFWLCLLLTAACGTLLALVDNSELNGRGDNPSSHLGECFDSSEALFSDGVGLGVLEPLWRCCTIDGLLWTLLRGWTPRDKVAGLGLGGLLSALGIVFAAFFDKLVGQLSALKRPKLGSTNAPTSKPAHNDISMGFYVEWQAYAGYAWLFCMGLVREYAAFVAANVCGHKVAKQYIARERWSSGWVDFYLQHMYKNIIDCFHRPIVSAPDACIDVVQRARRGGLLFGPMHSLCNTGETKRCVNFASYNYLGFGGSDEHCTPAAWAEVLEHGFSAAGTRTEGGTLPVHRELECEVAEFLGKEDSLVLGMGFATNATILPALFEVGSQGILVISDELNHRSIVEGVRLSGATVRSFLHNDMAALEKRLQEAVEEGQPNGGAPWRKIFVCIEGIYSMEGDFCRLREIVTLKNKYKSYLFLDEAHSIGAVGPTGRGVTELLGVPTDQVDIMMGTFTKSFGSAGGYVASSRAVIDALRQCAPGSVFASAMSPPCAAQALTALRVISGAIGSKAGAEKLERIKNNSNFFRECLQKDGFKILGDVDSPIIPAMLHHPRKMAAFSRKCLAHGIAVVVVGYPAVPVLYERVRFCISAAHTRDQLAQAAAVLAKIGSEVGVLYERGSGCGSPEATASRATRAAEHGVWLRSAPLERASVAEAPSKAVSRWTPEPLAPSESQKSSAAAIALEATRNMVPRDVHDFRLFDPLGYAAQLLPAARTAAEQTINFYGFGACGPRGFYGTTQPHLDLEASIVEFLGTEAAIAYSAGVVTASSILPALVQRGDRVIVDAEANLSIRTGLRLCRADIAWVAHGDLAGLEAAFAKGGEAKKNYRKERRTFVITEAISQRTGRLAPLAEIVALKEKHGALLILDETLSFGVLGAHGRGLPESDGIDIARIDAIIGSLEHATANIGGFCAGRHGLVDHQRLAGAGYCFSAACPPLACSAAAATLRDIAGEGGSARRAKLVANAALLHDVLLSVASTCSAPVELVSSRVSYVQHLRWVAETAEEEGEEKLSLVAGCCADEAGGGRIQVCTARLCGADPAFGVRIGAPSLPAPSLRICASADTKESDIRTLGEALCVGLSKLM